MASSAAEAMTPCPEGAVAIPARPVGVGVPIMTRPRPRGHEAGAGAEEIRTATWPRMGPAVERAAAMPVAAGAAVEERMPAPPEGLEGLEGRPVPVVVGVAPEEITPTKGGPGLTEATREARAVVAMGVPRVPVHRPVRVAAPIQAPVVTAVSARVEEAAGASMEMSG